MPSSTKVLIVTGPTATGKTKLAVAIARRFHGEIISADSRQVYRGLDIGTGKDLEDYGTPPNHIPHHLIDVAEPDEDFHLLRFIQLANQAIETIHNAGHLPIVTGGTPLYLNALINAYDMPGGPPNPELREKLQRLNDQELKELFLNHASPELQARADLTQRKRLLRAVEIALTPAVPDFKPHPLEDTLIIAPYFHRDIVRQRILQRLDARFQQGMAEEVQRLHDQGVTWQRLEWFGLEYRYIARFLQGITTFQQMHDDLLHHIRKFAKAQDIWFRKLERENHPIHWLPDGDEDKAMTLVNAWLDDRPLPPPELVLNDIRYGKCSS